MQKHLADILILSDDFELRGSCLQTLSLASELPKHQFGVRILTTDASQIHPNRQRALNLMINPYLKYRLLDPVSLEFIAADLAEHIPDIIHIQTHKMHLLGRKLAIRLKRPYVLTLHSHLKPQESLHLDPHYGMGVICISKSVQESLLVTKSIATDKSTIISSGVKIPPTGSSNRLVNKSGILVVGTAGPLESNKGLIYFVEAAGMVLQKFKQVQFLIAGAGPEEKKLRLLTKALKIQSAFTFVPDDYDLEHTLQAVDIFCLPSLEQGLGTIMLQAMAYGIPVVASRISGVNSVVTDEVNGLLVPPRDAEQIATAILKLIDDQELSGKLQMAGKQFVECEYPLESMVQKHAACYLHALERYENQNARASETVALKT